VYGSTLFGRPWSNVKLNLEAIFREASNILLENFILNILPFAGIFFIPCFQLLFENTV
jgi:hypothetical protein